MCIRDRDAGDGLVVGVLVDPVLDEGSDVLGSEGWAVCRLGGKIARKCLDLGSGEPPVQDAQQGDVVPGRHSLRITPAKPVEDAGRDRGRTCHAITYFETSVG